MEQQGGKVKGELQLNGSSHQIPLFFRHLDLHIHSLISSLRCCVCVAETNMGRKKQAGWSHQPLTPLMEGPDVAEMQQQTIRSRKEVMISSWWREWFRSSPPPPPPPVGADLRLLVGVLACPLAPIPTPLHPPPPPLLNVTRHTPLERRTGDYIIQQYVAATTSRKHHYRKNMYAAGTITPTVNNITYKGCFVVWQMSPGMWSLELVVGGCKVAAGSDSNTVWRHTPWLGTHAGKGPHRPLRRIIQGLDPMATASLFASSCTCVGEKRIGDEDCFVVKVAADRESVMERKEGPEAEVIRHVLYGYFSQRSGLVIYLEDSHLTRIHDAYWETTIGSSIGDYREVDGLLIAHRGRTVATVFRFGDTCGRTSMEELWSIDEVAFDVPGLSLDSFIPPADI